MKKKYFLYLAILAILCICICLFSCEKQTHGTFHIIEGVGTGENFTMPYKKSDGLRRGDTLSVTEYGWGWGITNSGSVPDRKVIFLGEKK